MSEPVADLSACTAGIQGRRSDIEDRLAAIEAGHVVRILYACESGSRAWGFASRDSDWDVRFLYVHPPEERFTNKLLSLPSLTGNKGAPTY